MRRVLGKIVNFLVGLVLVMYMVLVVGGMVCTMIGWWLNIIPC